MIISTVGLFFLVVGILVLVLPLILVELSRPRDWLIGGLFLFLGLFLLEENGLLRGPVNLLVISMSILYAKLMFEIFQNRWNQLSSSEKKIIGSFERWFISLKQLSQSFMLLINSCLNFFKSLSDKSKKSLKEKMWVHQELKKEVNVKMVEQSVSTDFRKTINQELPENE